MTSVSNPAAVDPLSGEAGRREGGASARQAATHFEAMVIGQLLQPIFDTIQQDETFGGGEGEAMFKPMLLTEYANLMEKKGGIGLEPAIEQVMQKTSQADR